MRSTELNIQRSRYIRRATHHGHLDLSAKPYLFKENLMKVRSILLIAASAMMLPLGGALMANTDLLSGAANAESSALNLLAQTTPAEKPEGGRRKGTGRGNWGQALNLTPEQQAQIKTIRDQERAASEGLRQEARTARQQLRTLLSGNASDAQIRQQHQKVQQLGQQLRERRFDTMLKVRAVLTPEQRAKSAELKQQRGERRGRGQRQNPSGTAPNAT